MANFFSCLLTFMLITRLSHANDYFYDVETRVEPIFKQVSLASFSGMFQGPKLGVSLGIGETADVDWAQLVIRAKMSEIMEEEIRRIFTGLQHVINSIRGFSQSTQDSLRDSQYQISSDPSSSQSVASRFVSSLLVEAKMALSEILLQLKHDKYDKLGDVNSLVLQDLFLRIANDILKDSDIVVLEQKIIQEVEQIIDRVFSDKSALLTEDLLNQILTELHDTVREISPLISGREAQFQDWIAQQLSFGLRRSGVHINNLKKFAEDVVHSAAIQSKKVCERAYQYFGNHKEELGDTWKDIEKLVASVTAYQPPNK